MVGAGFIVRDCHLVAYADAGFKVVGLTSRTEATAREVAALRGVPRVFATLEALLDEPEVEVVDVAVPPTEQPGVIRRILDHPRTSPLRGILAQKPLAMSYPEAKAIVDACAAAGVVLQVNQNMRYDHSGTRPQDAARPRRTRARRCSPRSRCGPSRTGCPGPAAVDRWRRTS